MFRNSGFPPKQEGCGKRLLIGRSAGETACATTWYSLLESATEAVIELEGMTHCWIREQEMNAWNTAGLKTLPGERRRSMRFPLRGSVDCTFRIERAPYAAPLRRAGQLRNLSTGGCCFDLEKPAVIDPGMNADVRVDWPAKLNGEIALQLHIWGSVLRVESCRVVVAIHRFEFQTKGKHVALSSRRSTSDLATWMWRI